MSCSVVSKGTNTHQYQRKLFAAYHAQFVILKTYLEKNPTYATGHLPSHLSKSMAKQVYGICRKRLKVASATFRLKRANQGSSSLQTKAVQIFWAHYAKDFYNSSTKWKQIFTKQYLPSVFRKNIKSSGYCHDKIHVTKH